jgi:glycosyltransferase involved in cell wall biosynthesis
MKIALLTPWYPDERQPFLGLFIREQAIALAKRHEVYVIITKVDYSHFSLSKYSLVEFSDTPNLRRYHLTINKSLPLFNQLHHIYITWKVSKAILQDKKVDLVHSFIGYPGAIWAWMISRTFHIPFVHTEHTKLSNNYRSLWHKYLTNFGMHKASAITTVSKWLATQLIKVVNHPVHIIPNLIDIHRFKIGTSDKSRVLQLGFLGGLNTHVKGLDVLLEALGKYHGDFVLHVGGEGLLKNHYMDLAIQLNIAEKCKFYGSIQQENISSFFQQLHFFVCASRHETFSIAIIESLASGVPVLSTKCGGPEEILINDSLGILVESESALKLLDGIKLMESRLDSFNAEKMHEYVKSKYSIESIIPKYEEVYENTLHTK